MTDRWMDRQTGGWMIEQNDRQMDGQTDRWMDGWIDGQTDGWTERWMVRSGNTIAGRINVLLTC